MLTKASSALYVPRSNYRRQTRLGKRKPSHRDEITTEPLLSILVTLGVKSGLRRVDRVAYGLHRSTPRRTTQ
ncbi:uncharacterized [Tachysurus ichikawai]